MTHKRKRTGPGNLVGRPKLTSSDGPKRKITIALWPWELCAGRQLCNLEGKPLGVIIGKALVERAEDRGINVPKHKTYYVSGEILNDDSGKGSIETNDSD